MLYMFKPHFILTFMTMMNVYKHLTTNVLTPFHHQKFSQNHVVQFPGLNHSLQIGLQLAI